jgi:hypothetical protein
MVTSVALPVDSEVAEWADLRRLARVRRGRGAARRGVRVSTRRRYAATLLGASLALGGEALGGCSGGDDPPSTRTTTASSTSSTSSATTPPTATSSTATSATSSPVKLPPEATKHTEKGAEAFVKFYMDQANTAWTTPDTTLLPPLSDTGCLSCKAIQETAVSLKKKGQRYAANPVTVTSVTAFGGAPKGQQYVRLLMDQHKVNVVDSTGKVVLTDPAKKLARTAGVVWKGGTWLMYDLAQ